MKLSLSLSLLVLLSISTAQADEPGLADEWHPFAKEVNESLKDRTKPFILVVHLKVKEGKHAEFVAAFKKAAGPTRKEKGNSAYQLSQHTSDSTKYMVYEVWSDLKALDAHLKAPYLVQLQADLESLLDADITFDVQMPLTE